MGRLLTVHPCPVCSYHVDDNADLHEGGSGIAALFLRNHYALAICGNCQNLVSVLVPNTEEETQDALKIARRNLVQVEADATIGDKKARDLLPLLRQALDTFDEAEIEKVVSNCTMCGSENIEVIRDISGEQFDDQDAWIQCPRCAEGRLLIETSGEWN